ncbi:hypothetical protein CTA2_769, partial [Colletotrichum tanaceti]
IRPRNFVKQTDHQKDERRPVGANGWCIAYSREGWAPCAKRSRTTNLNPSRNGREASNRLVLTASVERREMASRVRQIGRWHVCLVYTAHVHGATVLCRPSLSSSPFLPSRSKSHLLVLSSLIRSVSVIAKVPVLPGNLIRPSEYPYPYRPRFLSANSYLPCITQVQ